MEKPLEMAAYILNDSKMVIKRIKVTDSITYNKQETRKETLRLKKTLNPAKIQI
jgi:hypothetical protein